VGSSWARIIGVFGKIPRLIFKSHREATASNRSDDVPPPPSDPKLRVLGMLWCLLLSVSGCSSNPEIKTVTLTGHVVDSAGTPLEGIDVGYYKKAVFASDSAATTDSNGEWEFEVPEAFMAPPAGRVFFQDTAKKWAMSMHRASELPEPVVLKKAPPPPADDASDPPEGQTPPK
jgi:hypothetical protein